MELANFWPYSSHISRPEGNFHRDIGRLLPHPHAAAVMYNVQKMKKCAEVVQYKIVLYKYLFVFQSQNNLPKNPLSIFDFSGGYIKLFKTP